MKVVVFGSLGLLVLLALFLVSEVGIVGARAGGVTGVSVWLSVCHCVPRG